MINKIIVDYLTTNKRLVIPQFGAFIRKEGSETIVFVPFLKKDDGVLLQLLTAEYGMDAADAQAVVDEYVTEIKESISTRGAYIIEGVGKLMTDSNGVCYLERKTTAATAPAPEAASQPVQAAEASPAPAPAPSRPAQDPRPAATNAGAPQVANEQPKPVAATPIPQANYRQTAASRPTSDPRASQPRQQQPFSDREQPFKTQSGPSQQRSAQTPPDFRRPAGPGASNGPQRPPMPQPGQPRPGGYRPPRPAGKMAQRTKTDGFIIVAIVAAVVALAAIIFGLLVTHGEPDIQPLLGPSKPDTTVVQKSAE